MRFQDGKYLSEFRIPPLRKRRGSDYDKLGIDRLAIVKIMVSENRTELAIVQESIPVSERKRQKKDIGYSHEDTAFKGKEIE